MGEHFISNLLLTLCALFLRTRSISVSLTVSISLLFKTVPLIYSACLFRVSSREDRGVKAGRERIQLGSQRRGAGAPGISADAGQAEVNAARRNLLELYRDHESPFLLERGEVNNTYPGFSAVETSSTLSLPRHMDQGSRVVIFLLLRCKTSLLS